MFHFFVTVIFEIRSDWLVGCRVKANCLFVGPGPVGGVPFVGGGSFYWFLPHIYVSFDNCEQLGLQPRPDIESGTSLLSALSAEPLDLWWDEILSH